MRVALFGIEIEENLGLRSIHAAVGQAGHDVELFLVRDAEDAPPLVGALLAWKPLLGTCVLTTLFGDNIKALFGMSTELAGDTVVQKRRQAPPKPRGDGGPGSSGY